jgi:hypothetical protein
MPGLLKIEAGGEASRAAGMVVLEALRKEIKDLKQ